MTSFTSEVRTLLETDEAFRNEFIEEEAAADFAAAIIELRKRRGMTQRELADLTGMKQSAISRLENANYSRWSFATMVRIAKALRAKLEFRLEPIEHVYGAKTALQVHSFENERAPSSGAGYAFTFNERLLKGTASTVIGRGLLLSYEQPFTIINIGDFGLSDIRPKPAAPSKHRTPRGEPLKWEAQVA